MKTFSWRHVLCNQRNRGWNNSSRGRGRTGIRKPPVCHIWPAEDESGLQGQGNELRLDAGWGSPRENTCLPLLLILIQHWPLSLPPPLPSSHVSPFPSYFTLSILSSCYRSVPSLHIFASPTVLHFFSSSFFFSDRDLWPEGCPGHRKSSSSSQLPLSTT